MEFSKSKQENNREIPFAGMHWILDHGETISDRNIERVMLRQAIMTGLVVILLAYVVMPRLTRFFHKWLHA